MGRGAPRRGKEAPLSGWNHWNGGNGIRYNEGRNSTPVGRPGIHRHPKLKGVVFNVLGNASKMAVCFKIADMIPYGLTLFGINPKVQANTK